MTAPQQTPGRILQQISHRMKDEIIYSAAFIIMALLYVYQYIIFLKKGSSAKGGSLSFAVFYFMLAFFVSRKFENLDFLLILFPAISLLVTILQWREGDNPKWLQIALLIFSLLLLFGGSYTLWQNKFG